MNKKLLFLPLALLALGACAGEPTLSPTGTTPSGGETTVTTTDSTNYGTEAAPLTVSEAVTYVATLEAGEVTKQPIFVKGIIGHNWDWKQDNQYLAAYFSSDDGTSERAMSLLKATFKEGIDFEGYKGIASMVGKEVLATGVASYYVKNDAKVIKIEPTKILSIADPETPRAPTEISCTEELTILADGKETKQIETTIKPYGCLPQTLTYTVTGNDHVIVDAKGNVKVNEGATDATATVTVSLGELSDTCIVKVTLPVAGQTSTTLDCTVYPNAETVKETIFDMTVAGVHMLGEKGTHKSLAVRWWDGDVRMYKGNTLTFTPDANTKIVSISIDTSLEGTLTNGELTKPTTGGLLLTPTDGTLPMVLAKTNDGTAKIVSIKLVTMAR